MFRVGLNPRTCRFMDESEDDSCSHYQINLQQFKQTIREKANLGFRSLGRTTTYTARRSIQFIDELPASPEEGSQGKSLISSLKLHH